jgi:hypothetical protein
MSLKNWLYIGAALILLAVGTLFGRWTVKPGKASVQTDTGIAQIIVGPTHPVIQWQETVKTFWKVKTVTKTETVHDLLQNNNTVEKEHGCDAALADCRHVLDGLTCPKPTVKLPDGYYLSRKVQHHVIGIEAGIGMDSAGQAAYHGAVDYSPWKINGSRVSWRPIEARIDGSMTPGGVAQGSISLITRMELGR